MDPDILTRCAFGLEKCTSEKPCPFHDKFKGIREELRDSLSEISVYDMALKTEQRHCLLKELEIVLFYFLNLIRINLSY